MLQCNYVILYDVAPIYVIIHAVVPIVYICLVELWTIVISNKFYKWHLVMLIVNGWLIVNQLV